MGKYKDVRLTPSELKKTGKRGTPLKSGLWSRQAIREAAAKTGVLPHEWLYHIMCGNPVAQFVKNEEGVYEEKMVYPDFSVRVECARHAAPYYAAKVEGTLQMDNVQKIIELFASFSKSLPI